MPLRNECDVTTTMIHPNALRRADHAAATAVTVAHLNCIELHIGDDAPARDWEAPADHHLEAAPVHYRIEDLAETQLPNRVTA
jgi:hypothetical protein